MQCITFTSFVRLAYNRAKISRTVKNNTLGLKITDGTFDSRPFYIPISESAQIGIFDQKGEIIPEKLSELYVQFDNFGNDVKIISPTEKLLDPYKPEKV